MNHFFRTVVPLAGEGGRRPEGGIKNQDLSRLVSLVFTPLGEPSVFVAWRGQYLRRLAGPVFTLLDGSSVCAAWRANTVSILCNDCKRCV